MGTSHIATYTVVRLWEEDPRRILEMESPGLCPLLPLIRGEPKELFVESRQKIESSPEVLLPAGTRQVLLAAMMVLAGRVIKDKAFLKRCITEVQGMGDNWVIEEFQREARAVGLEEGHAKGRAEGRTEEARRAVLRVLERRFGEVAQDIRTQVEGFTALERLELLHDEAVTCASLAVFRELLQSA